MLHNKKAANINFLAAIIIVLIGFFVTLPLVTLFASEIPDKEADQICKLSVASRAKSKLSIKGAEAIGTIVTPPLICKTSEFTINAKGKTDNEIMKEFLGYAARAWNVFGEGNYGGGIYSSFLVFGSDTCFRYYNIKVKNLDRMISKEKIVIFMKDNKYEKKNVTYWNYMAQRTAFSNFEILDDIENQHIYSILFADITYKKIGLSTTHYNEIYIADLNERKIVTGEWSIPSFGLIEGERICGIIDGTGGQ